MRNFWKMFGAIAILFAFPAQAKTIIVKMKNSGKSGIMVFEPAYVPASVGDIVRFLPVDPGHNAQTISGMVPVGVNETVGKMNQPVDIKLTKAGFYGIECKPHLGLGMVALIKAGDGAAPNAAAVKAARLPPLAMKRMAPLIAAAR